MTKNKPQLAVCKATLKERWNELEYPGDFCYTGRVSHEGTHGMLFVCPCGSCSKQHAGIIHFNTEVNKDEKGPIWDWNGNEKEPTITPSIQRRGACEWHGYLTNGEFKQI